MGSTRSPNSEAIDGVTPYSNGVTKKTPAMVVLSPDDESETINTSIRIKNIVGTNGKNMYIKICFSLLINDHPHYQIKHFLLLAKVSVLAF